jgi:hypothetical protein
MSRVLIPRSRRANGTSRAYNANERGLGGMVAAWDWDCGASLSPLPARDRAGLRARGHVD